jgi:hypothetical protein
VERHLEDNQEPFAAGPCAEAFASGRPAVTHDATMERRLGEIALTFVESISARPPAWSLGESAFGIHPIGTM